MPLVPTSYRAECDWCPVVSFSQDIEDLESLGWLMRFSGSPHCEDAEVMCPECAAKGPPRPEGATT